MSANLYEWLTSQLLNQLNKVSLLLTPLGYTICAGWRFRNWFAHGVFLLLKGSAKMENNLSPKFDHIKALNEMPEEEWRFWAKVDTSGDCWIWRAGKDPGGYGVFTLRGVPAKAHRCAWLFTYGEVLPSEIVLMHRCDNPACVNPSHLKPGTHFENAIDMGRKGRASNDMSQKLTRELADQARQEYKRGGVTQAKLAKKYGICYRSMQELLSYKTFK